MKYTLYLMFVEISLMFASVSEAVRYDRKPFGRKMCEKFCKQILGCSSYGYSAADLGCLVSYKSTTEMKTHNKTEVTIFGMTDVLAWTSLQTCPKYSRAFQTKARLLKCETRVTEMRRMNCDSLLIVDAIKGKCRIHKLNLEDYKIDYDAYPSIATRWVSAAIYVPSQDRFLLADSNSVQSFSPRGDNNIILTKHLKVFGMDMDEEKQLLFLASIDPRGVWKVKTDGLITKYSTRICSRRVRDVEVSSNQEKFYAQSNQKIFSATYDGLNTTTIADRLGILQPAISIDKRHDMLYCSSLTDLYRITLTDVRIESIHRFDPQFGARTLVYSEGYIGISPTVQNVIKVITPKSLARNIQFRAGYFNVVCRMC